MKKIEDDSIFWYGLKKYIKSNSDIIQIANKYNDFLAPLYKISILGLHQYMLYTNNSMSEISFSEYEVISDFIVERIVYINDLRDKYKNDTSDEFNYFILNEHNDIKNIICNIFFPFINEYNFKALNGWKENHRSVLEELMIIFQHDLEEKNWHKKTSCVSIFLITLVIIKNHKLKGLFQRVIKNFDRSKILNSLHLGRRYSIEEEEYLLQYLILLEDESEWNLFISNFSTDIWTDLSIEERFGFIFKLSIFNSIFLKDKIEDITQFGNGDDIFDLLNDYLPLFIYSDKIIKNDAIDHDYLLSTNKILLPYSTLNLNSKLLNDFIQSYNLVEYSDYKLDFIINTTLAIFSKIKSILTLHTFLEESIDNYISKRERVYCDILNIFKKDPETKKYKPELKLWNINKDTFYFNDEELKEMSDFNNSKINKNDLYENKGIQKLGMLCSFILGLNPSSAKMFEYKLFNIVKYIILVFGSNLLTKDFLNEEQIYKIYEIFKDFCLWYENEAENIEYEYVKIFSIPLKLLKHNSTESIEETNTIF